MQIPGSLQTQRRWLLWRDEDGRKVPYYAVNHRRRSGAMDTEDDWRHLVDYKEAVRIFQDSHQQYTGFGYAITHGHVLIDLDDVIVDGAIQDPWVKDFIEKAKISGAFVEVSYSGSGVHVLGPGVGEKAGHKGVNIEIYTEKRFVAITGIGFGPEQCADVVGDCTELARLAYDEHRRRVNNRQTQTVVNEVRIASPDGSDQRSIIDVLLSAFDADDREQWVKVGLALGRAFPNDDSVFEHYQVWGKTSDKHNGQKDDKAMRDIFYRQSSMPSASKYTIDTMLEELSSAWPSRAMINVLTGLFLDQFGVIESAISTATIEFAWDRHVLTLNELENRPAPKRFIIDRILPAARTAMIGRGGLGKTMLLLYEALHVASGNQLYNRHDILDPGRVLIVTAEEERDLLVRRSSLLLDLLPWRDDVKKTAFTNIAIQDVSSKVPRLIGQNKSGEFQVTPWTDKLIDGYKKSNIKWVIFDPISAFGMNENAMNDSAVVIMEAATRMSEGLNGAAVTLVHHTSKEVARNNIVDSHSGRGGSAFGDASRGTRVLTSRIGLPAGQSTYDPETRTSRLTLHHVKSSYAAPVEPMHIDVVDGYDIRTVDSQSEIHDADEFWKRIEQIVAQEESLTGHSPSIEVLTRGTGLGVSRNVARQRLMDGIAVGRAVLTMHPTDKRKRGIQIVKDWNGF